MQRKLLGVISVDFTITGQLLIIYSAFMLLEKNGNTMKQCHQLFRDFKKFMIRSHKMHRIFD